MTEKIFDNYENFNFKIYLNDYLLKVKENWNTYYPYFERFANDLNIPIVFEKPKNNINRFMIINEFNSIHLQYFNSMFNFKFNGDEIYVNMSRIKSIPELIEYLCFIMTANHKFENL